MTNWCSPYSQNTMVSFEYIDFLPKILLFRNPPSLTFHNLTDIKHPTMLSSCRQKFLIFFSFCIFSNTAPTFYCQDWNTKQIFTLFWVSCSNDVHERTSLKTFLSLSTGCFTLVWMFVNGSGRTEKFWFCWNFSWICSPNYAISTNWYSNNLYFWLIMGALVEYKVIV